MNDGWKSFAIGLAFFVIGFMFAIGMMTGVEKIHIEAGHIPYGDKDNGIMWLPSEQDRGAK